MESTTSSHEAQTEVHPALATVVGDQCTNCGSPLAPDQRYCVHCGQRRGQLSLPAAQPAVAVRERAVTREVARLPRFGVNTALIAGVGVLLLAMGVGVLIGRSSQKSDSSRAASPVQVVTVGGGGGGGTSSTAAATTGGGKAGKLPKGSGKSATAAQAAQAAKQIKGANIQLPKKAVVKIGQPGTGPGYQNGKFTGNFFGG